MICYVFFVLVLVDVVCIINCIFSDSKRCSVLCNGVSITKNELYDETHCVAFNIRFNLNNDLSTELRAFPCKLSNCILEIIDFDCFNETLIIQDQGNGTGCEGNFYFELIQVLVVTVKNKNSIPLLYSHNYFCTSSSRVAFYFYNLRLNNPGH